MQKLLYADAEWSYYSEKYSKEALKTREYFKKLDSKFRPDTPYYIKEFFQWCTVCKDRPDYFETVKNNF